MVIDANSYIPSPVPLPLSTVARRVRILIGKVIVRNPEADVPQREVVVGVATPLLPRRTNLKLSRTK